MDSTRAKVLEQRASKDAAKARQDAARRAQVVSCLGLEKQAAQDGCAVLGVPTCRAPACAAFVQPLMSACASQLPFACPTP